jgi:hypothetical protein
MKSTERELAEALASEIEAEIRPARVRKPLTRGRIFVISLASLLSLTFIWFAIASTIAGSTQVKTQDIGFEVVSDQQVDFRFTVSTPAELSNPATCAVQALNQQFAIVGYKEVALPAKNKAGEVISVTVNTTELAVSGLVDYCWLD